ncbi:MAG: histidine phosphatase family protein [Rhodospirillaceae bacterium]
MSATTRWWWIRHAPVINHGGRIYGHNDVDADTVSNQACFRALAAVLPVAPVWLVTPLRRTSQTLAALVGAMITPEVEPELMEQNFGVWQGMTHAEILSQRGAEAHRFWISPACERPSSGESFVDVVARVRSATARLSARHRGRDIVAVAHGGSIRAALAVALGLDPEIALRFSVHNISLTRIDHIDLGSGGPAVWRVESVNVVL